MKDGSRFRRGTRFPIPGDFVMVYRQIEVKQPWTGRRLTIDPVWEAKPGIFVRFRSYIHGSIDSLNRVSDLGIDLESPLKGKFHVMVGRDMELRHTEDLLNDVMVISGINDE